MNTLSWIKDSVAEPSLDRVSESALALALRLWNGSGTHFQMSMLASLPILSVNGTGKIQ